MDLQTVTRSSNDVRVPASTRGEAVVVTRYRHDSKAVVLHPDDFALLQEAHAAFCEVTQLTPSPISDTARRAALEESTPSGSPVEDAARLRALFNLDA